MIRLLLAFFLLGTPGALDLDPVDVAIWLQIAKGVVDSKGAALSYAQHVLQESNAAEAEFRRLETERLRAEITQKEKASRQERLKARFREATWSYASTICFQKVHDFCLPTLMDI